MKLGNTRRQKEGGRLEKSREASESKAVADEAVNSIHHATEEFNKAVQLVRLRVKPGELYAELKMGRREDEGGG